MATFIQGVTDEFGPIVPYQPNWDFLDKVYGTKQAEYDRGFQAVKNIYTSLLNSPVTNAENDQFRKDMFRKIQGSLRNLSGVDLSNPNIVRQAASIMNPISQDQELAYDMSVTRYHQAQKERMNQIKNSNDPKTRALYSKYSEMDIGFAEQDMKNAKRGDGSITQIQPRDFVAFEDVNEYLREAAKQAGLKIELEGPDGSGYILKKTNGEEAKMPFAEWAAVTMGNRFDRQFDVMGRVEAESEIRKTMQETGVSRQDAVNITARKLMPSVKAEAEKKRDTSAMSIAQVEDQIAFYKKNYKDGFPENDPSVEEKFLELLDARDRHRENYLAGDLESKDIDEGGEQYIAANIYSKLTGLAKQQAAVNWATVTASATQSLEVRPDQTWINKAQIASREREAALNRAMQIQMHNEKLTWDKQKHSESQELKIKIAQGKGELPGESHVGRYTTPGEQDHLFGVDVLDKATSKSRENLFSNVFAGQGGLINLAINDDDKRATYLAVINKVNDIANGQEKKLSATEIEALNEYGRLVGKPARITNVSSSAQASALIDDLASFTYQRATKNLDDYAKDGKMTEAHKYAQSFNGTLGAVKTIYDQRTNINKSYREINSLILNSDGTLKDAYKAAVRVGTLKDGTPIYDLSKVDDAHKNHLDKVVSAEFVNRQRPIGNSYNFTGVSASEMYTMIRQTHNIVSSSNEKIDIEALKQLPLSELNDLFANAAQVSYDPTNEKAYVELNVAIGSKTAAKLKLNNPGTINLEIPYSSIQSAGGSMSRFGKYISQNTVYPDSYGLFEAFSTNPKTSVKAPESMAKMGFDYTAVGTTDVDGRYGVQLVLKKKDPVSEKIITESHFLQVNPSDPESFTKLNTFINTSFNNYKYVYGAAVDAMNQDGRVYYMPDSFKNN
jgi:hypothetical protein